MKTVLLSITCAAGLAATLNAQVLPRETARNVLIGGIAGAIIGDHNDNRALEGAAIGVTAGLVWSALTSPPPARHAPPVPVAVACPPPRVIVVPASRYYGPPCDRGTIVVSRPRVVAACPPPVVYHHRPAKRVVYVDGPRYSSRRVVYRSGSGDCR
jgi:hypothetical protein